MARFEEGNKAAEKWTEDDALKAFNEMLEFTMNTIDVLSVQQAYIDYGMHSATYYYLQEKFPVLESIKKGINDVIIARVNNGALNNDYQATASIWRMKQLGEIDSKEVKSDNKHTFDTDPFKQIRENNNLENDS